jgi:hypothetical protein
VGASPKLFGGWGNGSLLLALHKKKSIYTFNIPQIEAFSINIGISESFPLFGPITNSKLNPKLNLKKGIEPNLKPKI